MWVFDTGADLEVGSSMIKLLKFGDMYPCMDTGAGIWLKIIQISINRVIKLKLWDIMWKIWGEKYWSRGESWRKIKGKALKIEISYIKGIPFLQLNLSISFDYINRWICPKLLPLIWSNCQDSCWMPFKVRVFPLYREYIHYTSLKFRFPIPIDQLFYPSKSTI